MASLGQLFALALVVMGLSHTVARERLFEPLRRRCGGKEAWLGYLLSCPYCVSHWMAFLLVPLTGLRFIEVKLAPGPFATILSWFLSSILVAVLAAFCRVIFYFVDESQGLVRRRQRTEDEERETHRAIRERIEHPPSARPPSGPPRSGQ